MPAPPRSSTPTSSATARSQGANVAATAALARRLKTPVIASGGIASLDDIAALKAHENDGIAGAILGRALYDGRVDLAAALALAAA